MTLTRLPVILMIAICSYCQSLSQQLISTGDELEEYNDLSRLSLYRTGTSVQQISSYDRQGKNDDGFSGTYSFLKRNKDSTLVMFEAKGPGAINRIWTPTPTDDTLDFYVDDSVFSVKYSDLFSGKVDPFTLPLCGNALGGYYCYYPILFQDSCRIVSRGKKLQFHQVQWRSYAKETNVKRSFKKFLFRNGSVPAGYSKKFSIASGKPAIVFERKTGGRILGLKLFPASAFAGKTKDKWIRIRYDGEAEPAIFSPVQDFFGFAFGQPSMQAMLVGVVHDTAYCNIPIPFDRSCTVEILNNSSDDIECTVAVNANDRKRNVEKEGKLFASFKHERYEASDGSHVLLDVHGRGHFIGTILQCQGTVPGMTLFFEGDDSTVVDGKLTLHGTGSEDYFNGGWYAFPDHWDDGYSLPLHGSLDYNLARCRTGAYRFYMADKIPFERSFFHSIEHGPVGNNIPAIYTSLSFYYGTAPMKRVAKVKSISIYEPDTAVIYPQVNDVNVWDGVSVKSLWAHDTGGMSFVYTVSDETRLRFSLDEIALGRYDMYLDFDQLPAGTQLRAMQRQTPVSEWMDTYAADTARVKMLKVGIIEKTVDVESVTFHFRTPTGRNQFFLNRFILVRRR